MEGHPIPQNITSFEFHLVGDMTIKQFIYLAIGLTIAYLSFAFIFPVNPYISLPIIAISSTAGAAFAFLPISDRPLDHWLKAYLKAAYSPTQAYWNNDPNKKAPKDTQVLLTQLTENIVYKNRLSVYLSTVEGGVWQSSASQSVVSAVLTPQPALSPTSQPITQTAPLPTDEQLHKTVELARQLQLIQLQIVATETKIGELKSAVLASQLDTHSSTKQFQQVFQNLQGLVKQASEISHKLTEISSVNTPHTTLSPTVTTTITPSAKAEHVKVVPTPKPVLPPSTGLKLTSAPNVVNGVVTDATGNYLEGVIAIIHNKDGLPVRALKTNKLGQFTGATPLASGVYTLILEKDNLTFDTLEITLNDAVLPPLQIAAKKGGS